MAESFERCIELTFGSDKVYADPFNDIELDVIFSRGERTWRVPAFWRGDRAWTVRFAPPAPGDYAWRLLCSDSSNASLHGCAGRATVTGYEGNNELLRRGPLRVSANKRYFEHADGTPFFWLGDTWWTGLSDRLSWEGFQTLTADRKAKGFTVVQIVAGLVPWEEQGPSDPGFCNEGGAVWEGNYERINPRYFDHADRRIFELIDAGLVPALVGAWFNSLPALGIGKMKQHWRYLIARYGAYPVFWIVGGEVFDPPEDYAALVRPEPLRAFITPGWTEITRYVRDIDPYHHPLTAHEGAPPADVPLQDASLTDFDLVQSSHFGWPSIAAAISQINRRYARTRVVKPVVQGEIGYETFGETHFANFQRAAFWLSMLNGAAGFTYGANGTYESYTSDKPLHRIRWSFMSWEEGMHLPGSALVGAAGKLLRHYPWWQFEPHPEWVSPRGTTLLEPREDINGFDRNYPEVWSLWEVFKSDPDQFNDRLDAEYPGGEWQARRGNFRRPYAAGVPGVVRIVYLPNFGIIQRSPPTVLGLEPGIRYHGYLWECASGTRVDLGVVESAASGTWRLGKLPTSGDWLLVLAVAAAKQ